MVDPALLFGAGLAIAGVVAVMSGVMHKQARTVGVGAVFLLLALVLVKVTWPLGCEFDPRGTRVAEDVDGR